MVNDTQLFDPNDFQKWGTWTNSTFFNASSFLAQREENYIKELGISFELRKLLVAYDEFFWLTEDFTKYMNLVKKDPVSFLQRWNERCQDAIKKVRNYVDAHKDKTYQNYSNEELFKAFQELQKVLEPLYIFLYSYIYASDAIEEHIIQSIPNLNFKEIRPLYKVSSEVLNELLLSDEPLENIHHNFAWYGLNLLREKPLTIEKIRKLKETATKPELVIESQNPLLRDVQLFMWLKFERIDIYNYAFYWMNNLYTEIFKRINLDKKYLDVLFPEEIGKALLAQELPLDLDFRFEHRGMVLINRQVRHLSKEECKRYKELFSPTTEFKGEIKGKIACKGIVRGPAKIVRDTYNDISKVEEGDILIAVETIVQCEPYMKKTAGMVVEMGSLLSHSAIFAREFNIPAIVGVQNATKMFKDGDIVEIDADRGIVRKIS